MKVFEQYISDDGKFTGTKSEVEKYEKDLIEKKQKEANRKERIDGIVKVQDELDRLKEKYFKDYPEEKYYGIDIDGLFKKLFNL